MKNKAFHICKLIIAIFLGDALGLWLLPKGTIGLFSFMGMCIVLGFLFSKIELK